MSEVVFVDFLGVSWTAISSKESLVDAFGLQGESISASLKGRWSKIPSTRPSRCGVGPMDVGTTGLNNLRLKEGVTAVQGV